MTNDRSTVLADALALSMRSLEMRGLDRLADAIRSQDLIQGQVDQMRAAFARLDRDLFAPMNAAAAHQEALRRAIAPLARDPFWAVSAGIEATFSKIARLYHFETADFWRQIAFYRETVLHDYAVALDSVRPALTGVFALAAEAARAALERRDALEWAVALELGRRGGWWIAPSWDLDLLQKLAHACASHRGKRVVVETLRAYYEADTCRELARMVRLWTLPEIAIRRPLIRSALHAYRRRDYAGCVKLLVGLEEGIVKDYLVRVGALDAARIGRKQVPTLLTTHVTRGRESERTFEVAFTAMFDQFRWGSSPAGDDLNRHRIAHGAVPGKQRAAHALRLFLVLDTLDYLLTPAEADTKSA